MNKIEFYLAKGTTPCLECGDYRIPYKNKENIS
jgi:hypothetical protein